jgi:CarD family transcriptional regulator
MTESRPGAELKKANRLPVGDCLRRFHFPGGGSGLRSAGYPGLMRLAVGDAVVYTRHGVGRVAGREQKLVLGRPRECVLLDLAGGLRVTLPIEQARERLRTVASEADLRQVQQTLRADAGPADGAWTKRMRAGQAKLASGGPLDLAEIVRDGIERDRPSASGSPQLSIAEKELYVHARQLLAQEISLVRRVKPAEADAWIEAQVALPESGIRTASE